MGVTQRGEPSSSPSGPRSHHLPQNGWRQRWSLGSPASLPTLSPRAPSRGLFTHLTWRKAHQGHEEQGEQGPHGWRREDRVAEGR